MTLYYSHKTLEYDFCTRTPKLSNQNTIGYSVMTGYCLSVSIEMVLNSFITIRYDISPN